ncbi:MAG: hypothetical protein A2W01_04055 [Candidatus Solincola sediminis]|uniref:Lipoprotein n=1 Tax=Candidatus Solincola sediminis TaxID=1797199 RepID=A0A1F2WPE7_9ACTN|nr:MAG: hypothetical protein A2W01_04055 [Candidatus Solincola sediminis]OFW58737.1 MAG: hypothetical protein A2Y75_10605 [Candidatus Solincola sediminis]
MKKGLTLLVLLALMVFLFATVGCGEKKTTTSTPEGDVTVSEDDDSGSETVTGDDGDTTYKADDKAPSEDDLGSPIYPGAKYVEGSGGTVTTATDGETSTMSSGEFTTTDSYAKVVEWYIGKLGTPYVADNVDAIWMPDGSHGGYDASTVQVTAGDGKVTITIANLGL